MSVSLAPLHFPPFSPLYRLTEAKGRELIGTASIGSEDNWNDSAWQTTHKGNGNAVQNYTQQYTYDEVGNILQLQHIAGTGSYTRDYTIDSGSNRMEETELGVNTYAYTYDTRGNMSEMPHLDEVKWNATNELCFIRRGSSNTHYQYSGGQRVRKFTDKGIVKEERIYLGSFEIYRKFEGSSLKVERHTVHVSDDSGRIAMLEKRTFGLAADDNNTAATLVRYIYSNHLQSASLELDDNADIISYEEYHPYGTTSYQATNASIKAVAKRYRYTGKERDDESGLYYHGARYYIPWLCRWTAVDPLEAEYAGLSPYHYSFNNPVMYNDPSGMEGEKAGLWIETFNKSTNTITYHWAAGAQIFDDATSMELSEGEEFTGISYKRFMYHNGEGTVLGFSDGSTLFPSDANYAWELANIAKEGITNTFSALAEYHYKDVVFKNFLKGIKVDNFGIERQSPRMYQRIFPGGELFINQGGISARGAWTTARSAWQDPFSNYTTSGATKWMKRAEIFGEGLGMIFDAKSFYDVAKGGSPLALLPLPVDMIMQPVADDIERTHFEVLLNDHSRTLNDIKDWINIQSQNTKNSYKDFYSQLSFVYTSDVQLELLQAGKLDIDNFYFSSQNFSATKATLIWKNDNNYSIIKTYDIQK